MEYVIGAVAVAGVVAWAVSSASERARQRRFRARFATDVAFLGAVDHERVAAVKHADGRVAAVRALRAEHPDAPLSTAVWVVDRI